MRSRNSSLHAINSEKVRKPVSKIWWIVCAADLRKRAKGCTLWLWKNHQEVDWLVGWASSCFCLHCLTFHPSVCRGSYNCTISPTRSHQIIWVYDEVKQMLFCSQTPPLFVRTVLNKKNLWLHLYWSCWVMRRDMRFAAGQSWMTFNAAHCAFIYSMNQPASLWSIKRRYPVGSPEARCLGARGPDQKHFERDVHLPTILLYWYKYKGNSI